jgi:hypothetical protein
VVAGAIAAVAIGSSVLIEFAVFTGINGDSR